MSRKKQILLHSTIGLLVFIFVAIDLILLWVATGPRRLESLTPYLADSLSPAGSHYTTRIGDTWVSWGGWAHPIDIRLRDIKIITQEGKTFTSFSEISLDIDFWSLPLGRILPTAITINQPAIRLFQNEDHSLNLGFGTPETLTELPLMGEEAQPETLPLTAVLSTLFAPEGSGNLRKLKRFNVHNANVAIGNNRRNVFFALSGVEIMAKRNRRGNIRITLGGNMHYKNHQSIVGVDVTYSPDMPTIHSDIVFENLIPGTLASLFTDNPAFKIYNAPLGGKASLSLNKDGTLNRLLFNVNGGGGYIDSDKLANSIPINTLHAEGQVSNGGQDIQVDRLAVTVDKITIGGSGIVSLNGDNTSARAQISIDNVPVSEAGMFWPPSLSPISREWILENISKGTVKHAEARLNIQPGDLAKPILPKEAVDASIRLEGATVRYLPEHPPVTDVKSTIHVDGLSLTAHLEQASFLQATKLSQGKLEIADLNADNPYIKIALAADTTAKDAVQFLDLPRLKHAAPLNFDVDTAQGTAHLKADLGFNFFAPLNAAGKPVDEPDISYDVAADLKDFSIPAFMKKFAIKNGNGSFTINNRQLEFKGTGNVNGATVSQSDIVYKFQPEEGYDTFIDVTAAAPMESLPKFGYPSLSFVKGTLGVKASVKQGAEMETSSAAIDLTNAALDVPSISWKKQDKEPATLDITAQKQNGVTRISAFKLDGKGFEAAGSAGLSKDLSSIRQVKLQKAVIGKTDLSELEYEEMESGALRIIASGKSADVRPWTETRDNAEPTFSLERFPAVYFKMNVDTLVASSDGKIRDFKGELHCDSKLCNTANVTGRTGENKEFNFRILKNPKGKRQLSLSAADAGSFLKSFGIYPNIEGGALALTGNYDELVKGSILKGRFLITDYTVKKAPVLAKILSLASLTGVVDLMQNKGISFTKLAAPFTLKNDVIKVEKAKAFGGSIGITTNGTITFPKRTLNLDGTVVPAYVVNNIIGKVPVVGTLLTGGDGQGVFAFSYTVKGTGENPDVSVNPLSILAPGFLRGMFSGGDSED